MNLFIPKTSSIPAHGVWNGRDSISGVFLKRHRRDENVQAIKSQVEENNVFLDPEKWLLLIEAHGIRFGLPQENRYVHEITDEHGLNVEDPIVNPFTSNIAIRSFVDKVNAATSVMVTDYLLSAVEDLSKIHNLSNSNELIRFSSEAVAESFNVSARSVKKQFSRLSLSNEERLKTEIDTILKIRQRLIDKSNELSREQLEDILLNNQEPNVLIMTGGAHEEVFQSEFGTSSSRSTSPLKEQFGDKLSNVSVLAGPPTEWVQDMHREVSRLEKLAVKSNPSWEDFLYVENGNGLNQFHLPAEWKFLYSKAAVNILSRIMPEHLPYLYSQSNLMSSALKKATVTKAEKIFEKTMLIFSLGIINNDLESGLKLETESAALALKIILEKIGESLPDRKEILVGLLSAPSIKVQDIGAEALLSTSKHSWRFDNEALFNLCRFTKSGVARILRKIELAIVSADPRFLFATDENGRNFIYRGKDIEIENIVVECAKENDPVVRGRAFETIRNYLEKGNRINNPELDSVLIKGLENKDENAALAVAARYKNEKLSNPRILPLIIRYFDNPEKSDEVKNEYFNTFGYLLLRQSINEPRLKPLARKNLKKTNENIRVSSTNAFALTTFYEQAPNVTNDDIQVLFDLSKSDPNKLVKNNCTYGLSLIAKKDMDLFTLEQLNELENLCVRNRFPDVAADYELKAIDETYEILSRFFALRDLSTLVELGNHPAKGAVEQLIRRNEKLKETIGVLVNRIQEMHEANQKLERKIDQLQGQNQDLTQEIKELKEAMENLVKDLEKYKMLLKTKHVNKLLWSVGGTAARNIYKGRGIMHSEFAKSVVIDGAMDQLPDFINWLRGLN